MNAMDGKEKPTGTENVHRRRRMGETLMGEKPYVG